MRSGISGRDDPRRIAVPVLKATPGTLTSVAGGDIEGSDPKGLGDRDTLASTGDRRVHASLSCLTGGRYILL
jgi:hypothetical protein